MATSNANWNNGLGEKQKNADTSTSSAGEVQPAVDAAYVSPK
jgi:hypothetical protein